MIRGKIIIINISPKWINKFLFKNLKLTWYCKPCFSFLSKIFKSLCKHNVIVCRKGFYTYRLNVLMLFTFKVYNVLNLKCISTLLFVTFTFRYLIYIHRKMSHHFALSPYLIFIPTWHSSPLTHLRNSAPPPRHHSSSHTSLSNCRTCSLNTNSRHICHDFNTLAK